MRKQLRTISFLGLLWLIFFPSKLVAQENKDIIISETISGPNYSISEMKRLIIEEGSSDALRQLYWYGNDLETALNYAFYLLCIHNDYNGYPYIFDIMKDIVLSNPNEQRYTIDMALAYLYKGCDLGYGLSILGQLYIDGKFVEKDVEKGRELLNKAFSGFKSNNNNK